MVWNMFIQLIIDINRQWSGLKLERFAFKGQADEIGLAKLKFEFQCYCCYFYFVLTAQTCLDFHCVRNIVLLIGLVDSYMDLKNG